MSKKDIQNATPVDPDKVTHIDDQRRRRGGGGGDSGGGGERRAKPRNCYRYEGASIVWERSTGDGMVDVPLCNFIAKIERQLIFDDGLGRDVQLEISGQGPGRIYPTIAVSAANFNGMSWVVHQWGTSAVVYAGSSTKDHLRAAIQSLSGNAPEQVIYRHTGWRKFGEAWRYLHCGGALGVDGTDTTTEVDIGEGVMAQYILPAPLDAEANAEAMLSALGVLRVCPAKPAVGVVLLSSVLRAVLAEAMPSNNAPHLMGTTGTRKSTVAAIAQAFFGAGFSADQLPVAWADTGPAIETKLHAVKDAIAVVDDFKPKGPRTEVQRLHSKADQIIRSLGNQQGRSKLRIDHALDSGKVARALMLSTGEDTPSGESCRARMMVVDIERGDVDLVQLTELQKAARAGQLAAVTAGWVQALAPCTDMLKAELPALMEERRTELPADWHGRTASAVAAMSVAWDVFGVYALACGLTNADQWGELAADVRGVLYELGTSQQDTQQEDNEARQFVAYLNAMLLTGRVHMNSLADDGRPGRDYQRLAGWRDKEVDSAGSREVVASGECIGWIDEGAEVLWLEVTATYHAVQQYAGQQGDSLSVTAKALGKRLKDEGLLAATDSEDRNTKRLARSFADRGRVRCWVVPIKIISHSTIKNRDKRDGDLKDQQKQNVMASRFQNNNRDGSGESGRVAGNPSRSSRFLAELSRKMMVSKCLNEKDINVIRPVCPDSPVNTRPPTEKTSQPAADWEGGEL